MKKIYCLLTLLAIVGCQKKTDLEVLTEISNSLQNIQKVQYDFHFEQKSYASESSNYSYSGIQAIDFTKENNLGADVYSKRFSRKGKEGFERLAIGDTLIKIKSKTKTIVKSPKTQIPIISGNVVLYFNIFDLRKSMPLIMQDSTVTSLRISDTTVANVPALDVKFDIKKIVLGGNLYDSQGKTNTYNLIVRKKDHMPLLWGMSSNDGSMAFIYKNIQLDIDAKLWQYNPQKEYTVISGEEYRQRQKNDLNQQLGKEFPKWSLKSIRDKEFSDADFKGQVTLYEFFFVGCAGSIQAKPFIQDLKNTYGSKLNIINVEIQDYSQKDVLNFVEKYNLKEPALIAGKQLANQLGVLGCPTYILVDTSGKIRFASFGDNSGLKNLIKEIL